MYVDPMTLFILGEVLVVYIIINIFLFYKSRLYKVLLALLKEMRFEKLRREQLKKGQLAFEHMSNRGILNHSKEFVPPEKLPEAKSLTDQISERIFLLNKQHPEAHDLTKAVELNASAQWLRMRILELENELLKGNITEQSWQELVSEAISRLKNKEVDEKLSAENRRDSAENERYTAELQTDLTEAENKLADARLRIGQLEAELSEFKTISTPSESYMESPHSGLYEDEIYRLKCNNFDLNENINKLKLELQKEDPSTGNDAYVQLMEAQLANLEQYINSADTQNNLLEKELAAAQKTITKLNDELSKLGTNSKTVDLTPLNQLNDYHLAKTEAIATFRNTVNRLKNGESPELISSEQEAQIASLEQIIRDSQRCIAMLESELQRSTRDIEELEQKLSERKAERIDAKLDQLSQTRTSQKRGMNSLKTLITDIRDGGDTDSLLTRQEQEIEKLEGFLNESETAIKQLEAEIDQLQDLLELQQIATESVHEERPESDESQEEMEELLQQFIGDIQSLMRMINLLEDENATLRGTASQSSASGGTRLIDNITDTDETPTTENDEI
ncbi:MAG: hypothetical protein P8X74_21955 [Reinekea sp.]